MNLADFGEPLIFRLVALESHRVEISQYLPQTADIYGIVLSKHLLDRLKTKFGKDVHVPSG